MLPTALLALNTTQSTPTAGNAPSTPDEGAADGGLVFSRIWEGDQKAESVANRNIGQLNKLAGDVTLDEGELLTGAAEGFDALADTPLLVKVGEATGTDAPFTTTTVAVDVEITTEETALTPRNGSIEVVAAEKLSGASGSLSAQLATVEAPTVKGVVADTPTIVLPATTEARATPLLVDGAEATAISISERIISSPAGRRDFAGLQTAAVPTGATANGAALEGKLAAPQAEASVPSATIETNGRQTTPTALSPTKLGTDAVAPPPLGNASSALADAPTPSLSSTASPAVSSLAGSEASPLISAQTSPQTSSSIQTTVPITAAQAGQAGAAQTAAVDTATQIADAIKVRSGEQSITVRLDPPELGSVQIDLSFDKARLVTATLAADSSDTASLLRRNADHLAKELAAAGFDGVDIDFGEDTQLADQRTNGDDPYSMLVTTPLYEREASNETNASAPLSLAQQIAQNSGIDIRL